MKIDKKQNNLDEMLEQKLLQTEKRAMYIALFGLLAVTVVQVLFTLSLHYVWGELLAILILCGYMLVSNSKNGIWGKGRVPTVKTNALVSLVPASVLLCVCVIITAIHWDGIKPLFIVALFSLVAFVYLASFALLEITRRIHLRKRRQLEDFPEE